jgi:hypothetical protein
MKFAVVRARNGICKGVCIMQQLLSANSNVYMCAWFLMGNA